MKYRLRTLLVAMVVGPPLLAWVWIARPPLAEIVGCVTLLAICSLAYWSLGLSAKDYAALLDNAKRAAAKGEAHRGETTSHSTEHDHQ